MTAKVTYWYCSKNTMLIGDYELPLLVRSISYSLKTDGKTTLAPGADAQKALFADLVWYSAESKIVNHEDDRRQMESYLCENIVCFCFFKLRKCIHSSSCSCAAPEME